MKCQRYTTAHVARTCPQEHDTCGKCAGQHRTATCTDPTPRCVNCHLSHPSSDRACSVYLDQEAKYRRLVPDNRYRYFPVASDPDTWELGDWAANDDANRPPTSNATDAQRTKSTGKAWGRGRAPAPRRDATTPTLPGNAPGGSRPPTPRSPRDSPDSSRSRQPSPARQQTLHEFSPAGVSPARPRANTIGSATPRR
jgi:hypothetical protein